MISNQSNSNTAVNLFLSGVLSNTAKVLAASVFILFAAAFTAEADPIGDIQKSVKDDSKISETDAGNNETGNGKTGSKNEQAFTAKPETMFRQSKYEETAYNKLQFKFAHNSYERNETIPEMLEFNNKFKFQAGCRGVEFDCHQNTENIGDKDEWRWSVHHDGDYSADKPQIESYLGQLKAWSEKNPGHDPVSIYIEFKDAAGNNELFAKKFDELMLKKLAGDKREKFFTPADMMIRNPGAKNLAGAAEKAGWPKLRELRGKFIIVITGSDGNETGDRKEFYSHDPEKRLAFVDKDCGEGGTENFPSITEGDRIFMNIHVYHKNKGWHDFCLKAAKRKAFIVRGWKVNAAPLWNDCVKYGLNMLATDKVKNHPWAYIGGDGGPFRKIEN